MKNDSLEHIKMQYLLGNGRGICEGNIVLKIDRDEIFNSKYERERTSFKNCFERSAFCIILRNLRNAKIPMKNANT